MKVLFDISPLGLGHFSPRGRTGIYRTVEALARQLLLHESLDIDFSAFRSSVTHAKTVCYLDSQTPSISEGRLLMPEKSIGLFLSNLCEQRLKKGNISSALGKGVSLVDLLERKFLPDVATPTMGGYQVFHSTFYPLPPAAAKRGSPRRILTVYDLIPLMYPIYSRKNEQDAVRASIGSIGPDDMVIAISEATRNDLCTFTGMDPVRVAVTHLAASGSFFPQMDAFERQRSLGKYGIPEGPYVLSVGTLEPRKNVPAVLRCFERLARQEHVRDLNLVLVGTPGWAFDEIFARLEEMSDLKKRIVVTGYVEDKDLSSIYSAASMFVYPSLYEGFGLPPLEAMQCGIPVIVSNTSSLPEVVGDAGIMVDPRDDDAICQAMLDLYRKPAMAGELAKRSLARAKGFSWERCATETVDAYSKALAGLI